jgi:lipid-A-disaccharide synthase
MKPEEIMVIAGEASGDLLAAELVEALRKELTAGAVSYTSDPQPLRTGLEPRFFGAGGPRMKAAGVEIAVDLTEHSVIGLVGVKHYFKFRRLFQQVYQIALQRRPGVIVCVDFGGFNRRFAAAIKRHVRANRGWFHSWNPRIVQYVSPQVWASRAGRAYQIARDYDQLLSILPFEAGWYASRVPSLPVKFVGNPLVDRFDKMPKIHETRLPGAAPRVLLLPGSRAGELKRHLPVVCGALQILRRSLPDLVARMILPNEALAARARDFAGGEKIEISMGGLREALMQSDAAIAKTGTITLECAYFRVPTVTFYKTSWANYQVARRVVKVKTLTMPNLLSGEELFPEFIQDAATPENIASATLDLLQNQSRRQDIRTGLDQVIASLGKPGASGRAAQHIAALLGELRS